MADTENKESHEIVDRPAEQETERSLTPNSADRSEAKKGARKPWIFAIGGLLLILAIFYGARFYIYNRVHVSTDDAYVTGDLVNVSPQINGTLQQLNVQQGDYVKQGELLAVIDPSGPQATLVQAEANYEAARSQVPTAQQNLQFQRLSTQAAIQRARSALAAQRSRTVGAQQQVGLTGQTVQNQISQARAQVLAAEALWQQSRAQVLSAIASRDNYIQAVQTSRDALANYEQQITTAQHALQSANSRSAAAAALADRASKDAERFRLLYSEDAVSAQSYDQARSAAENASAQFDATRFDAQQAASQVESARRAAAQAQSQVQQARQNVVQANAQVSAAQRAADAAREQVRVARSGLGVAIAGGGQVGIQQSNLTSTAQQTGEAVADVATAQSGQAQVAARAAAVKTAQAQAQQAKAALTNAQITLGDTQIFAPADGEILRKDSNVGSTLSPGATIVTMTKGRYKWIVANFKETQLQDVRPGQPAEIEVDAIGGKVFRGHVRNIIEATGAATALLPPDNATGNFTKVVQRIPVRIELEAAPTGDRKYASTVDIANLRQGMSVTATIDTSNKNNETVERTSNSRMDGGRFPSGSTASSGLAAGSALQPGGDPSGESRNSSPSAPGQPGALQSVGGSAVNQSNQLTGGASRASSGEGGGPAISNPGTGPAPPRTPVQDPGAPTTPRSNSSQSASPSPGSVPGATGATAGDSTSGSSALGGSQQGNNTAPSGNSGSGGVVSGSNSTAGPAGNSGAVGTGGH